MTMTLDFERVFDAVLAAGALASTLSINPDRPLVTVGHHDAVCRLIPHAVDMVASRSNGAVRPGDAGDSSIEIITASAIPAHVIEAAVTWQLLAPLAMQADAPDAAAYADSMALTLAVAIGGAEGPDFGSLHSGITPHWI